MEADDSYKLCHKDSTYTDYLLRAIGVCFSGILLGDVLASLHLEHLSPLMLPGSIK